MMSCRTEVGTLQLTMKMEKAESPIILVTRAHQNVLSNSQFM